MISPMHATCVWLPIALYLNTLLYYFHFSHMQVLWADPLGSKMTCLVSGNDISRARAQ
jgi:hypothetical protein